MSAQREDGEAADLNVEVCRFTAKRAGARFGGQDARAPGAAVASV
jgi:hypothetical protein